MAAAALTSASLTWASNHDGVDYGSPPQPFRLVRRTTVPSTPGWPFWILNLVLNSREAQEEIPMSRLQTSSGSLVLATMLAMSGVCPVATAANTFTVNTTADTTDVAINSVCADSTGHCSLRAAVQEANGNPGADIINFAASTNGTAIRLTRHGAGEDAAATGDLDITDDVTITGNGVNATIIDGDAADRVFHVMYGATALLEHLRIQNGGAVASGGGIQADGGTDLQLDTVTVSGNHASSSGFVQGGGIHATGDVAAQFLVVDGNSAQSTGGSAYGGGLSLGGALVRMANSRIFDNTASSATSVTTGGGISSTSDLQLWDSVVRGNTAHSGTTQAYGGGIEVGNGSLVLLRVELADNLADAPASSAFGGGIESSSPTILVNTTVAGNQAAYGGGGIWIQSDLLTLVNVTIADNTSATISAGGLAVQSGASLKIASTLIANNAGPQPDCTITAAGTITSLGYNLIGNTSGCTITPAAGDQFGSAANPIDPHLGPLTDLGSSNGTRGMLPLSGSPAIDTGDPILDDGSGGTCQPADQANTSRPLDGDGDGTARCDIGAVEVQFNDEIFADGFD